MRKQVLVISLLVAALGSGVALAKGGGSGGGSSGSAMGGSSSGMQKSKPVGGKQMESAKGSQKAKGDAALKEQERERAREREQLQLQQKDGSGQAGGDPLQTRTQDRTEQQDRVQRQDQVKP